MVDKIEAQLDPHETEEVYEYLEELRQSGTVNMFGAAPMLALERGYDIKTARAWLSQWMKEY